MKHSIVVLTTLLALSVPLAVQAQKHAPPVSTAWQGSQLATHSVERYLINTFGEVDGLLLSDGLLVKFPAHQSGDLVRTVRPGDAITASGAMIAPRVMEAWTLTNTGSNATIARTPKSKLLPKLPKHLRAMSLQPLEATGRISHLILGKKGEVKSVVLEDGSSLRLGKHARWTIGTRLSVGRTVHARGIGTQNEFGRALEVTEIGVDGAPMVAIYRQAR